MNFAESLPVNFLWNSITAQFTYMKRKGSLQKLNQQLMFPEFFFINLNVHSQPTLTADVMKWMNIQNGNTNSAIRKFG